MYEYVYVYVYVYVYTYRHTHARTHTHTRVYPHDMHICICIYIYIYMWVCVCTCACVYIYKQTESKEQFIMTIFGVGRWSRSMMPSTREPASTPVLTCLFIIRGSFWKISLSAMATYFTASMHEVSSWHLGLGDSIGFDWIWLDMVLKGDRIQFDWIGLDMVLEDFYERHWDMLHALNKGVGKQTGLGFRV